VNENDVCEAHWTQRTVGTSQGDQDWMPTMPAGATVASDDDDDEDDDDGAPAVTPVAVHLGGAGSKVVAASFGKMPIRDP